MSINSTRSVMENIVRMDSLSEFFSDVGPLEFCVCLVQMLAQKNEDYFISVPILANSILTSVLKDQNENIPRRNLLIQDYLLNFKKSASDEKWKQKNFNSSLASFILKESGYQEDEVSNIRVYDFQNLLTNYHNHNHNFPMVTCEQFNRMDNSLGHFISSLALNFNFLISPFQAYADYSHPSTSNNQEYSNFNVKSSTNESFQPNRHDEVGFNHRGLSILQGACFLYFSRVLAYFNQPCLGYKLLAYYKR